MSKANQHSILGRSKTGTLSIGARNALFCCAAAVLALVVLAFPSPAAADGCEHDCETAIGCHGGCQIEAGGTCSAICSGGACNYSCKLLGGPNCDGEIQGACDYEPPPEARFPGETPWVVLSYASNNRDALGDRDLRVVSSSSQAARQWMPDAFRKSVNSGIEAGKRMRAAGNAPITRRDATPPPTLERMTLYAGNGAAGCVGFEHSLQTRAVANVPAGAQLYFRALTDRTGTAVEVEALQGRLPRHNRTLEQFLEGNLTVIAEGGARPVEAFGFITVPERGGEVSYGLAAVSPTEEVPLRRRDR